MLAFADVFIWVGLTYLSGVYSIWICDDECEVFLFCNGRGIGTGITVELWLRDIWLLFWITDDEADLIDILIVSYSIIFTIFMCKVIYLIIIILIGDILLYNSIYFN